MENMEFFNFEFKQLHYFVVVAEQNSFSRAAELLFVTQPLISQQISYLEQQLGVKLFTRQHHSLALTPAGVAFYAEAKGILEQCNTLMQTVQASSSDAAQSPLRIGFEDVFDSSLGMETLVRFKEKNADVSLKITYGSYHEIAARLFHNELDAAFVVLPSKALNNKAKVKVIGTTEPCLASGAAEMKDLNKEEFIAQLNQKPLFLLNGDHRAINAAANLCVEYNVLPKLLFLDSLPSILLQVTTGNGFALLPKSAFRLGEHSLLRIEHIENTSVKALCLAIVWLRNQETPLLNRLLDECPGGNDQCRQCQNQCIVNQLELFE